MADHGDHSVTPSRACPIGRLGPWAFVNMLQIWSRDNWFPRIWVASASGFVPAIPTEPFYMVPNKRYGGGLNVRTHAPGGGTLCNLDLDHWWSGIMRDSETAFCHRLPSGCAGTERLVLSVPHICTNLMHVRPQQA